MQSASIFRLVKGVKQLRLRLPVIIISDIPVSIDLGSSRYADRTIWGLIILARRGHETLYDCCVYSCFYSMKMVCFVSSRTLRKKTYCDMFFSP